MAQRIKTWDSTGYLKLSAILDMYYSEAGIHGDHVYRACNRLNNYRDQEKVDHAMLKEQVMRILLLKRLPSVTKSTFRCQVFERSFDNVR